VGESQISSRSVPAGKGMLREKNLFACPVLALSYALPHRGRSTPQSPLSYNSPPCVPRPRTRTLGRPGRPSAWAFLYSTPWRIKPADQVPLGGTYCAKRSTVVAIGSEPVSAAILPRKILCALPDAPTPRLLPDDLRGEDHRPIPEPTTSPAGSKEKLAEFARRARLVLQLFHPKDPRDGAQISPL
jgi:hypothetical protein